MARTGPKRAAVFVIDPNSIFRMGMTACLESLEPIGRVAGVSTIADAWKLPELGEADLVIVEASTPDVHAFVRKLRTLQGTVSLACGEDWRAGDIAALVEAGAVGVIAKETLNPPTLEANVRAALNGTAVLPVELVGDLVGLGAESTEFPQHRSSGPLSPREQQVLRLIANGHATREVATQLSYSERTIKNILHDVATKLGARSRSHAVAHAVREGLI